MRENRIAFCFLLGMLPFIGFSQSVEEVGSVVGFGCGKAGVPTKPVLYLDRLFFNKNYDSIRVLLNSDNPSIKYLSVKSCEYLASKKRMVLTIEERAMIDSIKKSNEEIRYCSGCTVHESYILRLLFSDEKQNLNKSVNYWLKRVAK